VAGFRALDEDTVYEGWVITVAKGRFQGPDGQIFERDVVHHPGAVAVVPLIDDAVVLVRQYRSALDTSILEIPAGLRDIPGEPLAEVAQRELIEEVGLHAGTLELLTSVHNSVGFCDEEIHIFLGTDLTETERLLTDSPEELEMEIVHIPILEVERMIGRGEITDAKTIIGVLAALRGVART
jgi:8-oxo-dGTP pyrophosphatase MutT (NUDIX family)